MVMKKNQVKYSIIIPTLNEKENIIVLLQRLEKVFPNDLEIIVVDENSPDETFQLVKDYARDKQNIFALLNDGVRGLSPSIVKGFDFAHGQYLCCIDGDLQHDESCLPNLFKKAETYDYVIGSRYVQGGGFAQKWGITRVIISRIAAIMANVILKLKIKDPTSGCFVISKKIYNEIRGQLNPGGFKIMLEILFRLKNSGKNYSIAEEGLIFRNRAAGKSKLSSKVIVQYLKMLFDLKNQKNLLL